MVVDHVKKVLKQKSKEHQEELRRLEESAEDAPLGPNVIILPKSSQLDGVSTTILDPKTEREDFIFAWDRISTLLIEKCVQLHCSLMLMD
jgi:uridine kinase